MVGESFPKTVAAEAAPPPTFGNVEYDLWEINMSVSVEHHFQS